MDPLTLAFAGGSSLLSGLFGSSAASQTAAANEQANNTNFELTEQARNDKIAAAQQERQDRAKQLADQQLGTTDSEGNRTHFVAGQGWVTDLSATGTQQQNENNQLMQEQGQEQLNKLNIDAPLQREQLQQDATDKVAQGAQADAFMRQLHTAQLQGKDKSTGSMMYGAQAQGINDAYNRETENATSDAVRQGQPNSGVLLAALARSRAKDLGNASLQDYLQGKQTSTDNYNSKISNLSNLASAFAGQAESPLGQAYQPVQVSPFASQSSQDLGSLQSGANQIGLNNGDSDLIAAEGTSPGKLDYQQPNYALANSLASFGNILAASNGSKKTSGSGNSNLFNAFYGNSGST